MKTLEEYNAAQRAIYGKFAPRANGIACPKCGAELFDTNPSDTLLSYPPQKNVHCDACGFMGYRIA